MSAQHPLLRRVVTIALGALLLLVVAGEEHRPSAVHAQGGVLAISPPGARCTFNGREHFAAVPAAFKFPLTMNALANDGSIWAVVNAVPADYGFQVAFSSGPQLPGGLSWYTRGHDYLPAPPRVLLDKTTGVWETRQLVKYDIWSERWNCPYTNEVNYLALRPSFMLNVETVALPPTENMGDWVTKVEDMARSFYMPVEPGVTMHFVQPAEIVRPGIVPPPYPILSVRIPADSIHELYEFADDGHAGYYMYSPDSQTIHGYRYVTYREPWNWRQCDPINSAMEYTSRSEYTRLQGPDGYGQDAWVTNRLEAPLLVEYHYPYCRTGQECARVWFGHLKAATEYMVRTSSCPPEPEGPAVPPILLELIDTELKISGGTGSLPDPPLVNLWGPGATEPEWLPIGGEVFHRDFGTQREIPSGSNSDGGLGFITDDAIAELESGEVTQILMKFKARHTYPEGWEYCIGGICTGQLVLETAPPPINIDPSASAEANSLKCEKAGVPR